MPNIRSAQKRVRQVAVRTARNRVIKTELKEARKEAAQAVESGDAKAKQESYNKTASAADKAAKKGLIHRNAASRIKRNLAKAIAG